MLDTKLKYLKEEFRGELFKELEKLVMESMLHKKVRARKKAQKELKERLIAEKEYRLVKGMIIDNQIFIVYLDRYNKRRDYVCDLPKKFPKEYQSNPKKRENFEIRNT